MIAPLGLFLIVLGLAVPLHWACPGRLRALRPVVMIATSLILTFLLNPLIPLVTAGLFVAVWTALGWAGADEERRRTVARGAWGAFAVLLIPELIPGATATGALMGVAASSSLSALAWLGLSYTALRAFLILREGARSGTFEPAASLNALTFFGAFSAGPIAGAGPYAKGARAESLELPAALTALARLGWGAALVLAVAPAIRQIGEAGGVEFGAWIPVWLNFIALYLDFAGYCDVAIASAALFGVTLPENFRLPFLATSIQAFWQRWHLTLGAVISTYLFKPLVRATGRPRMAIMAAFLAVGLWHAVDLGYLIWGVGHGAALALHMRYGRRLPVPRGRAARIALDGVAWAATFGYVSFLSAVAGARDFDGIARLLETLFGQ